MTFRTHAAIAALTIGALTQIGAGAMAGDTNPHTQPHFDVSVGYSHIRLGSTDFTTAVDYLNTEVIDTVEDHDGKHDGARIDFGLAGIPLGRLHDRHVSLGVNGFYGRYVSDQNSSCTYVDGEQDCVVFPLYDPDTGASGDDFTGGLLSDWRTTTERTVNHWGIGAELTLAQLTAIAGSLKDPVSVGLPFDWRVGLAYRRFDQDSTYRATDYGPLADPVTLKETIDTGYLGGYVGFTSRHELDGNLELIVSGEGGLYHARTDYKGRYNATDTFGGPNIPISQSLKLADDNVAFIGKLGIELQRDFEFARLGLFGMAEWYSAAPDVKYNNYERNGGGVLDLVGPNDGTSLGTTGAYSYTVGLKASVPLN